MSSAGDEQPPGGVPPIPDNSAAARQRGEPEERYRWFLAYLASPRPRLVATAARQGGVSESKAHRAARNWRWSSRADAYDHEQTRQHAQALADDAGKAAARTADAADEAAHLVRAKLARMSPDDIRDQDIAPLLRAAGSVASDMHKLAREAASAAPPPAGTFGRSPLAELEGDAARQVADARAYLHDVLRDPAQAPQTRVQAASRLGAAEQDNGTSDGLTQADVFEQGQEIAAIIGQLDDDARRQVLTALEARELGDGQAGQ